MYYLGQRVFWKPEKCNAIYAGFTFGQAGIALWTLDHGKVMRYRVPASQTIGIEHFGKGNIGEFAKKLGDNFFGELSIVRVRKNKELFDCLIRTLEA